MAWFSGKVNLGNFPDLAGAVNKISESVKNIEKNFDTALGFEEKSKSDSGSEASGLWPSSMSFMGQKGEESSVGLPEHPENTQHPSSVEVKEGIETLGSAFPATEKTVPDEGEKEAVKEEKVEGKNEVGKEEKDEGKNEAEKKEKDYVHLSTAEATDTGVGKAEINSLPVTIESSEPHVGNSEAVGFSNCVQQEESSEVGSSDKLQTKKTNSGADEADQSDSNALVADELHKDSELSERADEQKTQEDGAVERASPVQAEVSNDGQAAAGPSDLHSGITKETRSASELSESQFSNMRPLVEAEDTVPELVSQEVDSIDKAVDVNQQHNNSEIDIKDLSSGTGVPNSTDSMVELEKVKKEMKMMETALQGAARQAQAKADEIAKMMNENELLKAVIEDLRRKSSEAEIESLREEYHQRVATLERKVYALTKERDTLRREQSRKSDAAALLKEKDEIINQVMAEGEELSKKQAAQESQIRKLRGQIRELEEEKKGLSTKLQVEENKVESIKRDKAATEKLLQETIENHQAELAAQKEYYTNALTAAKEAEALAEARANNEARTELESRLREAEEREAMLVQALEELRQTLSRKEQQADFREDMLLRDIDDLKKRYQASERRCEELITQVPESTRPLLRQIEAMQETTARRAEAWAAVERSLNSRLQEAEAKAADAEERERSVTERLSQTLSRINVLEAQISCLRAEQTQLTRSLEKERQRAAENRQEYLAAKEEADTQQGRANQLEEEIKELRQKHKHELHEALTHRELLQQEIEKERTARLDLERTSRLHSSAASDQTSQTKNRPSFENGNLTRRLSSASSVSSMEESYFLQASLDSSDSFSERRNPGETTMMSPYYMKSMTPSSFEAALRQKDGELASYMSRLASLESIRDSLAEELVKMTAQFEKLKAEAAMLPGVRAELEALRRRHSSALELMGERDEELEELRADIVDLKEMYREQVNLLVNKIQTMSSSMGSS